MSQRLVSEASLGEIAWKEVPGFFPASKETLFGVLTRPKNSSRNVGVIFAAGGWFGTSIGSNRMLVTFCRSLAEEGFPSMRFDYHGVGESTGAVDRFELHRPFAEDIEGAVQWMKHQHVDEIVLIGFCFGGRGVLKCAPQISGLKGVCLISLPVHDIGGRGATITRLARRERLRDLLKRTTNPWLLRNLFKPNVRRILWKIIKLRLSRLRRGSRPSTTVDRSSEKSAESPIVMDGLRDLANRRIPVLMLHGDGDSDYQSLHQLSNGVLETILASGDSGIEVLTIPGSIHGFTKVDAQSMVLQAITRWIKEL